MICRSRWPLRWPLAPPAERSYRPRPSAACNSSSRIVSMKRRTRCRHPVLQRVEARHRRPVAQMARSRYLPSWRDLLGGSRRLSVLRGTRRLRRPPISTTFETRPGQDRPAVVARRRYSMTVVLPTPVASEMRRVDKPRACSRNTSSIFLIGSLLIAPPRPLSQQLPGSAVVCLRPAPRDGARSDHPGRILLERVVGCSWNDWSDVHGIGGRITVVRASYGNVWSSPSSCP